MDQAQAKALAALQPFIVEATTTKNPSARYLSDLIMRATSAPGTYIFTELLQTPAIQSLRSADTPDPAKAHVTLLELFSWGTYQEYKDTPDLPALSETQDLKLRQLTLLTLASPFAPPAPQASTELVPVNNLSYSSLLQSLSLSSNAALEALITKSIYSSLITGRLSPTSNPPVVHITSVAPLRDVRPASLPALLSILETWSSRCENAISTLQANITAIRMSGETRADLKNKRQALVDRAVADKKFFLRGATGEVEGGISAGIGREKATSSGGLLNSDDISTPQLRNRQSNKRDLDQTEDQDDGDHEDMLSGDDGKMDVDEGIDVGNTNTSHVTAGNSSASGSATRSRGGVIVSSTRGAKRNRGRG